MMMMMGDLEGAKGKFEKAVERGPGPGREPKEWKDEEEWWESFKVLQDPDDDYAAAVNNLAVAELYLNGGDPLGTLKGLVRRDPVRYLTDATVFNICTMYDLGGDGAEAGRRKREVERIVKEGGGRSGPSLLGCK